jgi:hypothetical protein
VLLTVYKQLAPSLTHHTTPQHECCTVMLKLPALLITASPLAAAHLTLYTQACHITFSTSCITTTTTSYIHIHLCSQYTQLQ